MPVPVSPAFFRPGQIVQMQVSFKTAVCRGGNKQSFFMTLDTVLLLDCMGTEVSA